MAEEAASVKYAHLAEEFEREFEREESEEPTLKLLDALRKLVEAIDDYAPANFPKDVISAFNEANDLLAQYDIAMGQAKLRGTLEQRIEQAKAREQERGRK